MTSVAETMKDKAPLPTGWRWVRLGEVGRFESGGTPSKDCPSYWGGQIPFVTGADITDFYVSAKNARAFLTDDGLASAKTAVCHAGTVLFVTRTRVGRNGIATETMGASQDLSPYICGPSILPEYVCRYLVRISDRLIANCRGATIQGLKREHIESLMVPLPPLSEQKRITAILTEQMAAAERARAAVEAQLEAGSLLLSAYRRKVFDSEEAKRWPRIPLGQLAIKGPDNGVFKRREQFGRGVSIVNVSDLYRSLSVELRNCERVEVSTDEVLTYGIAPGDLFFCRSSLKREGIGWCCYAREVLEPAVFECHVMRVRVDQEKTCPEYVSHYWQHPAVRERVIINSRIATMTTMNQDDLSRIEIPSPTVAVQRHIAKRLSDKSQLIDRTNEQLNENLLMLKNLPAALLRLAFNGGL